jgi:hypothetical protein
MCGRSQRSVTVSTNAIEVQFEDRLVAPECPECEATVKSH